MNKPQIPEFGPFRLAMTAFGLVVVSLLMLFIGYQVVDRYILEPGSTRPQTFNGPN
jgi:hypothetical protein